MREIVALHDAGRAVSSVIDVESVSRKIVDAVAHTFDVQLAALWLVDRSSGQPAGYGDELRITAARVRRPGLSDHSGPSDPSGGLAADEAVAAAAAAEALRPIAHQVRDSRRPLRLDRAGADPSFGDAARRAGAPGPLVALPLDRQTRVIGVIAVGRAERARELSDVDLSLLTAFADQAGAAVENALLYSEVREARELLEKKVELRTTELTRTNRELGRAIAELREAQAQLVLSERMAGLGLLVAGVAHEINSPSAAIRGSIEGMTKALGRVSGHGAALAARRVRAAVGDAIEAMAPVLAERALPTGIAARKAARAIAAAIESAAEPVFDVQAVAAELADLGASPDDAVRLIEAVGADREAAPMVVAALTDHVYLQRTASTVRHAVASIQRIVGALKSYSHLDHQAVRIDADVHEGLETTLTLLHHALRDIVVERRFGTLPRIPVYVDELNQVWTNLIQNAQQAVTSRPDGGGKIEIDTGVEGAWVVVRVTDNGPGVPPEALPRIFEPFFTTKPAGEGTGLGLGIARQIVDKHGGTLRCDSEPGCTRFEVRLPVAIAEPEGRT
jgi:signal transduction histidine kinase